MEIGSKLKQARNEAKLTQEQIADELGVTRQTISNWENNRSYPDIVSVIKMSDLYSVSLDHLLKEDTSMKQTYTEFLEESTNVVKSKTRLSKVILITSYLVIWALAITVFWCFTDPADAMGYSLMFLWVILPVATFVISLLIGRANHWGNWKWLAAPVFGILYMLGEYATFSLANTVSFGHLNSPEYSMILSGALFSLVGLGIGQLIYSMKQKAARKRELSEC